MCDRYTITILPSELERKFPATVPDLYKPRFNAAPSQFLPIITNQNARNIILARWGFITDLSKEKSLSPKLYTKHIQNIKASKTWRQTIRERRCIILADGFYIWKIVSKRSMVPYRVIPRNGKIICLAGIWEENGVDRTGKPVISFSMITREAYRPVNDLNELMPVVLEQGKELKWLKDDLEIDDIFKNIEIEDWALLRYYPVSPKIGNIASDSPELIKEARTSDQHGNYTLFP